MKKLQDLLKKLTESKLFGKLKKLPLKKILAAAVILGVVVALACTLPGLFKGSLKLEAFTVDRSSVKTVYYLDEKIDFTGIRATVRYSDESLNTEYTYADLTITYPEDITATVGQKTVKVSFMDPHLEVEQSTNVQITVKEDPNAVKHASYSVDVSGIKTTYFVGDTLDFTGIKIIEKFTNGGADVEMTDLSKISYEYDAATITATTGTKSVVVKYNGENAGSVSVTVKYPSATSVLADTSAFKSYYLVGESVDLTGLTVNIIYENNRVESVSEFTCDAVNMNTAGEKQLIVKYSDPVSGTLSSITVSITVDAVENYTVDTSGMTLTYFEGDAYSFEGIKVTAHYHFAGDEIIDFADITFVHEDNLTATPGNKAVTVKVGDVTAGQFVVAVGDIVATPTLNLIGVKTNYKLGEAVDLTGLTLSITYNDPDVAEKTNIPLSALTVVTDLTTLTGEGSVNGKDAQITINYEDDVTGIVVVYLTVKVYTPVFTVSANPTKTTYYKGETFDYTGLTVLTTYKHLPGYTEEVLADRVTVDGDTTADVTVIKAVFVDGEQVGTITLTVVKNEIASAVVGGYNAKYEKGATVDVDALTVTVTYLDGTVVTLTKAQLTIGDISTANIGKVIVSVSFTDEVNAEEYNTSFEIEVIEPKKKVTAFEKPDSLSAFDSDNKSAGKTQYGQPGFSGEFAIGGQLYVIGDDNAFIMIPTLTVDDNGADKDLEKFFADVDIYVFNGIDYVLAEKSGSTATNFTYTVNSELIATVDTYNGEYKFAGPFEQIKISVKPSSEYYSNTENFNAVVLEATVIDAYNVYNANELSVVDNTTRQEWIDFKTELGLNGIAPAGIVLHNDISVKYTNVPSGFFYQSNETVQYRNTVTGEIREYANIAGMNYLIDQTSIYERVSTADFTIQGNFFTIDIGDFPLIASPSIFGDAADKDYGNDYSNATLFRFATIPDPWVSSDDVPVKCNVVIDNLGLIGNAGRDNWVVEKVHGESVSSATELVTAGGLIMIKSSQHGVVTLNNVINNSFFITYFPDYQGTMYVNDSKAYDSYQNAAFVWADSYFEINDSFINGTGGPIIITQSVRLEGSDYYYNPVTYTNNTVMDTALTGDEIWFKAIGATGIIGQVKANGAALGEAGLGNWCDNTNGGKMNIKAALMNNANNAADALTDVYVQGGVYTDGTGIDRFMSDETWMQILTHPALAQGAPFIVVYDAYGNANVLYAAGTGIYDLNGREFNMNSVMTDMSASPASGYNHAAIYQAFASADEIVLYQGGLAVLFALYH